MDKDSIETIREAYYQIKRGVDTIQREVGNANFVPGSNIKPLPHNFYTTLAIFVTQVQSELAYCESVIKGAEFIFDFDDNVKKAAGYK